MGKLYTSIDDRLASFIRRQHVFFVGTAPAGAEGHVNLSPKGLDTFRILDPQSVAYLDLTGSGVETIAHLRENGRITVMFCAFDGAPKILRLYGHGTVLAPDAADFATLRPAFPPYEGVRSIIRVAVVRIADSCGFAVPQLAYQGDRSQLLEWVDHQGPHRLDAYRAEHSSSIDGLVALPSKGR